MTKHALGEPNVASFATMDATREDDVTANAIGRGAVVLGKLLTVTVEAGVAGAKGAVVEYVRGKSTSELLQAAFELSTLAKAAKDAENLFTKVAMNKLLERAKTDGMEAVAGDLRDAMRAQGMPEEETEELLAEFPLR